MHLVAWKLRVQQVNASPYETVLFFVQELGTTFEEARELLSLLRANRVTLAAWICEWQRIEAAEQRDEIAARQLRWVS